jgi:hypothetical protein
MYDGFIARDLDADGDLDIVATRGNSGRFDGVFWLEQFRPRATYRAFTPAREADSSALPLPPQDWLDHYGTASTLVAPNKRKSLPGKNSHQ